MRKTAGILLGITVSAALLSGCGSNDATEAANESAQTEQEGEGEIPVTQESDASGEAGEASGDGEKETEPAGTVAVLFPDDRSSGTWRSDALALKARLEEKNYQVSVKFAGGDPAEQISQIQESLEAGVSAMILAPADRYALTDVLARVEEEGIPVFDFDQLIMDTDGLDYYITFDHRAMGHTVGEEIVKAADLEHAREEKQQKTIEFFMGSPDDMDALFFFNGVMETLDPYLDDGTLVCRSGQTAFEDTGTLRWDADAAKDRMREMLDTTYQEDGRPDIICTGFDGAAEAAYQSLRARGISPSDENWPLITGFNCSRDRLWGLSDGWLLCSVYLNRKDLASACTEMLEVLLKGETPEVSDYSQYDNGIKIIATRTCQGQLVDRENYQELLENGESGEEGQENTAG